MDQITFLDRTFYVRRTSDGAVEYPRDRFDVLGADLADESAMWSVLCAEFPGDAFVTVRDHLDASAAILITPLTGDTGARRHAENSGDA